MALAFNLLGDEVGLVPAGAQLPLKLAILIVQRLVQKSAAALQLPGAGAGELGVLGLQAQSSLLGLGAGHDLGPPVDHQQQQDQRPHGAQKHGQKGERRYLQTLPPRSHAAAPGLLSRAGCTRSDGRAVSK